MENGNLILSETKIEEGAKDVRMQTFKDADGKLVSCVKYRNKDDNTVIVHPNGSATTLLIFPEGSISGYKNKG